MSTTHECIQGSSFSYDFSCDQLSTFDADWGGTWAVVDKLEDKTVGDTATVFANGALALSGDNTKLELRIAPNETNVIPVGFYYLVVEINNAVIGFSQEVMQDEFEVKQQGI